ncbi:MAG TPA: polysaccharide deacetylase family protein [Clostridiaceae bacterium]|jgi:predicted polysaccharide deacetylase|nr:polysaccharide deacetylase family protein [Clostridiaceae bacterium]
MKRFLYKKHKFIYFIILVLIGMTLSFLSTYEFSFAIELSSTSIIDETFKEKFLSLSKSEQKIAYLTFDDGPTLKATPKILDILKEEDVVATFFVVGKHVKENPELVKRAYDEGHFIANHGYNHNNSKLYKNDDSFINEIKNTDIEIGNAIRCFKLLLTCI